MCQNENENENEPEDEDEDFRSFWIIPVTNEPGYCYLTILKDWFGRHTVFTEQTNPLVFVYVFVFVLAHEQPINVCA